MMKKLNKTTLALLLGVTLISAVISTAAQAENRPQVDIHIQSQDPNIRNQQGGQNWNNGNQRGYDARQQPQYQQPQYPQPQYQQPQYSQPPQAQYENRQQHWESAQNNRRDYDGHQQQWQHENRHEWHEGGRREHHGHRRHDRD